MVLGERTLYRSFNGGGAVVARDNNRDVTQGGAPAYGANTHLERYKCNIRAGVCSNPSLGLRCHAAIDDMFLTGDIAG